ncbi:MAG: type IX secretion system sortase PorU [Candidatus Syntrophosphaera sp.]|nr:type IX secretion system sortase PorU [Candidatus Syntrophosphaera sp.]
MKNIFLAAMLAINLAVLSASFTVVQRSENQLVVEFRLDGFTLSEQGDFIRVDAPGFDYPTISGSPLLPLAETKIGIPPGGQVSVTLLSARAREEKLAKRLLPVPLVFMGEEISEHRYEIEEALYVANQIPLLRTLDIFSYRGFDYVPLEIRPFAYDGKNALMITEQALFRIDISGNTGYRNAPPSDELAEVLLSQLLNPDQTRSWKSFLRYEVNFADFSRSDFWLRLETNRDGMFKITPSQLSGFPVSDIDPRSFRLFSTGGTLLPFTVTNPGYEFKEVPIRVVGESDGSFDPSDYIMFFGTTRDGVDKNQTLLTNDTYYNPYSQNTVYWLTFAGDFPSPPLRMATLPTLTNWDNQTSTFTDKARLETESQRRETIGFEWYMSRMFGNSTAEYQFEMTLSDVEAVQPQYLSMLIRQEDISVNIWHNISVYVNDVPVPADTTGSIVFSWRGTWHHVFFRQVSGFVNGPNQIRIKVIRSGTDNLFLDWITLEHGRQIVKGTGQLSVNQLPLLNYGYPVRYNISGSGSTAVYRINSFDEVDIAPLQGSGSSPYYVSTGASATRFVLANDSELYNPVNFAIVEPFDLTANPPRVDNIIISADEYASQVQGLADLYWQEFGKHSVVVKQSDIFNQFNGGHPDPAAIRQFLRYAWQNYPAPQITSVTLIGLGTMDWRNFSGQSASKNKVIVFQRNNITSDDYFVMLTQASHPELAVGRYPVASEAELNTMLANFQNYVQNPQGGWWRNSMVFLGDDLYNGSSTAYENIHTRQTQDAGNVVHPSILVDKIFAWDYEYDEFQNKPRARDDMLAMINEGRLVWYYIGHGSYDKLGAEDYFNGAADMGRFNNPDRLTLFMAASCKVSHFDYWGFESLGQKTVLLNNLGAIASYSATRISTPYSNAPMMQFLLNNLANGRNPIGYSIMAAKIQYTQSNDNDATYVLLGDPHLRITPPVRDSVITVSGQKTGPKDETFYARQLVSIEGGFSPSAYSSIAEVKAFNTETEYSLDWQTNVSHRGAPLYTGSATVTGGQYNSSFIVPDDVTTGNTGLIVSYLWDPISRQDYTNFLHPLALSDDAVIAENPDAPAIELFLGSLDFRPGDTVGTNPILHARISDSNGINVTGSAGHNILLILDNSLQPIPVTQYFSYNLDSHTEGLLTYQLSNLAEGPHTLQLIAFDNFNLPSVSSTNFIVKKSGELAIERFLIYPNPMQTSTSFTFMLSQDSDLIIDIYTVTGKKAHSFKALGRQGFNAISWNGKDARGDRFANNTYFVKVRATTLDGRKTEKTEKLVIYN